MLSPNDCMSGGMVINLKTWVGEQDLEGKGAILEELSFRAWFRTIHQEVEDFVSSQPNSVGNPASVRFRSNGKNQKMNKSLFLLLRSYIFWTHSHIRTDDEIFWREILDMLTCLRSLSIQRAVLERLNFQ